MAKLQRRNHPVFSASSDSNHPRLLSPLFLKRKNGIQNVDGKFEISMSFVKIDCLIIPFLLSLVVGCVGRSAGDQRSSSRRAILLAPWANFSAVAAAAAERNCSSSDRKKPTQLNKIGAAGPHRFIIFHLMSFNNK
jgi:hypothetical protein